MESGGEGSSVLSERCPRPPETPFHLEDGRGKTVSTREAEGQGQQIQSALGQVLHADDSGGLREIHLSLQAMKGSTLDVHKGVG